MMHSSHGALAFRQSALPRPARHPPHALERAPAPACGQHHFGPSRQHGGPIDSAVLRHHRTLPRGAPRLEIIRQVPAMAIALTDCTVASQAPRSSTASSGSSPPTGPCMGRCGSTVRLRMSSTGKRPNRSVTPGSTNSLGNKRAVHREQAARRGLLEVVQNTRASSAQRMHRNRPAQAVACRTMLVQQRGELAMIKRHSE